jgi:hypothetical protein
VSDEIARERALLAAQPWRDGDLGRALRSDLDARAAVAARADAQHAKRDDLTATRDHNLEQVLSGLIEQARANRLSPTVRAAQRCQQ